MGSPALSRETAEKFFALVERKLREGCTPIGVMPKSGQMGAIRAAAEEMGNARSTANGLYERSKRVLGREVDWSLYKETSRVSVTEHVDLPQFPDDDVPVEEVIDTMTRRFEKRAAHHAAKKWFPIRVKGDLPICLVFVGDPHVDDDGCNWPLLRRDIDLMKSPGVLACNIGDTTNNWSGRLLHLWGEQNTSKQTAWRLAKWLLTEAGIPWIVHLLGNHDIWQDGARILREMNCNLVPMEEWQAKFKLVFPNGRECRIWAAHNFPGHSQWNSLHGAQKAAHMKDWAHIYMAGHTHNWALHQEESATRDFTYWIGRARGYKFIDSYAEQIGHFSQDEGASIGAVIDPEATSESSFVQCHADISRAVDYTQWLRSKRG